MTPYTDGRRTERQARDELKRHGWHPFLMPGSKGPADIIAFRPDDSGPDIALVQVKREKRTIGPTERRKLLDLARVTFPIGYPVVCSWFPRQPLEWRLLTGPGPKDWIEWEPESV